jgi:phospholipase C
MDGFLISAQGGNMHCTDPNDPGCLNGKPIDVMGWHDAREIPNYWAYARAFVLQDHMFSRRVVGQPAHLYLVSRVVGAAPAPVTPPAASALQSRAGWPLRLDRLTPCSTARA